MAQAVLDARANHADSNLATLYDPTLMPQDLRMAHTALDRAVLKLYDMKGSASEAEMVTMLFGRYATLASA